ncbi:MAG: CDP-diacylglycerol--serine O-phosphatidyltransferase [Acidobacteriota bacterium]
MPHTQPLTGIRRGAYILPSLFTMGNILLGFYAVVLAYRSEDFVLAGWMIFVAGVLDGLDGRIARMTGTESELGQQLDSLADVLTFGATPAYLTFIWGLHELGRIGWLIPLFYLLCTTIRLARFNVQTKAASSPAFVGLPSPAGAAAIVALIWAIPRPIYDWAHAAVAATLIVVGTLMISTFRYPSFKRINFRRRWSYRSAVGMSAVLLVLTLQPQLCFQLIAVFFAIAGPLNWLTRRLFPRRREEEEYGGADAELETRADSEAAAESSPAR